jgi:predicted  nucleic acid-binding Zn-ribbon protein
MDLGVDMGQVGDEPLWSDERLREHLDREDEVIVLYADAMHAMRQMRDDYEHELAAARARMAQLEAELRQLQEEQKP